jgi:hypothetical protein
MFKINYRITEKEKSLLKDLSEQDLYDGGHIEGFFEIIVNNEHYGYYKSDNLHSDEEGFDLLTTWFGGLLETLILLRNNNTYVALSDIDSYNIWLEFKKVNNDFVLISVIKGEKIGLDQVITKPPKNKTYSDWKEEKIFYKEMCYEVLNKANKFITEVSKINSKLLQSLIFVKLQNLIGELKH